MSSADNRAKSFIENPKNSKKYLDEIWRTLNYGVAYISVDGDWLKVNSYLCEVLEYTESELLQRNVRQITHPDDAHDDSEMMEKLRHGNIDFYIMSKRFITKTGKIVWVKLKVTGIRDESEEFIHFISQITPAVIIESPEDDILHEKLKQLIKNNGHLAQNEQNLLEVLKQNLKWIITTVIIVLGFVINKGVEYREYQNKATINEKKISALENRVSELVKIIEEKNE